MVDGADTSGLEIHYFFFDVTGALMLATPRREIACDANIQTSGEYLKQRHSLMNASPPCNFHR